MSEEIWMNFEIKKDDVENGILNLLQDVRPKWSRESIVLKNISDQCCCNTIYLCYSNESTSINDKTSDQVTTSSNIQPPADTVIVRLCYHTMDSQLPKRSQIIHSFLDSLGLSARVLRHFKNGTCMEYIQGRKLDLPKAQLFRDTEILDRVTYGFAKFHSKEIYEKAKSMNVPENLDGKYHERDEQLKFAMDELEVSDKYRTFMTSERLRFELDLIRRQAEKLEPEKAFCHLDFSPQNMFLMDNGDIKFIDFDWSCISYVALDISSILLWFTDFQNPCEDDFPSDDYTRQLATVYLKHRHQIDGVPNDPDSVERLVRQIKVFNLIGWLRFAHVGKLLIAYCNMDEKVLSISKFYWDMYKRKRDQILEECGLWSWKMETAPISI